MEEGGDAAGARAHYERALAIDPNDATTHNNFGALLSTVLGEHEAAARHFGLAARLYTERGDVEKAAGATQNRAIAEEMAGMMRRGGEAR